MIFAAITVTVLCLYFAAASWLIDLDDEPTVGAHSTGWEDDE